MANSDGGKLMLTGPTAKRNQRRARLISAPRPGIRTNVSNAILSSNKNVTGDFFRPAVKLNFR